MSTDDSVSEDVSTSGALSHHVDGEAGKESEASLLSSEGTSASGRRATSRTTGGAVEGQTGDISPARSKIRSLCLSSEEAFEQEKNLPFINPSSLETLRALVQEIQSTGETDPEIWKDCEGRWLHLFQLVEKQYQEQILAQQEQYQCQIQLIQDEIKALVQLQNRQAIVPSHTDFPQAPETKPATDIFPLLVPKALAHDHTAFSSPSPPHGSDAERRATVLSSGYGTLSTWESTGLALAGSPGDEEDEVEEGERRAKLHWSAQPQEESAAIGRQQEVINPVGYQQKPPSSSSQQLTSWAQRPRLRARKSKAGPAEDQGQPHTPNPPETHTDPPDRLPAAGTSRCFNLKRSDSLLSEASGLTYWRLTESELYRQLPDGLDSLSTLQLQDVPLSPTPSQEPRLSLREIYQNKHKGDWTGSVPSGPTSPQVMALDPAATRQSDRTSGFTSPSHFSSPSFAAQPHLSPRMGSPDSPHPGDTDCNSEASSASAAGPWGRAPRGQVGSEEEGSHTHSSTLKPPGPPGGAQVEDPVVLSLLRQNLREKHSRHVADLKAYYESEIQMLRDKLELRELPQDLERSNQKLSQRCKHLEEVLSEATSRVQELEAANSLLEKKLAEWSERYAAAAASVTSLQRHLEDSRRSGGEKDATTARLRTRVRQLEEEVQEARMAAQESEERRERGERMLQELLGEFDSLTKEHQVMKNNLLSTENKLLDVSDQRSELKRVISKLESQVKQMEHENQVRARVSAHSSAQPSGAGLFHHPDLLLSPSRGQAEPDVTHRKSPCPLADQPAADRKSPFSQSVPSHRRTSCPSVEQSSGSGSTASSGGGSWRRCASPPEVEQLHLLGRQQEPGRREGGATVLPPVMRALIELEETRATQSRAPWVGSPRTTVGFVERRHKESIQERVGLLQVEREVVENPGGGGGGGGAARSRSGVERAAALLRAQRSLSPEGPRSSSLPPSAHRAVPTHTPTKRETLLAPLSAKSSPKRCPTENFSTALGHPLPREEHLLTGMEAAVDRRRHSFTSSSPRKKLQFSSDRGRDSIRPLDSRPQLGWEDSGVRGGPDLEEEEEEEEAPPLLDRLQSLSDAERLLDQLTQEKLQVEAALSRLPASGLRATVQTRSDEVALEKRLEHLNRELGSLRMILKRFHVLRCSTNT
ncbi:unnamed protein product [Ophioblennius macclurei]